MNQANERTRAGGKIRVGDEWGKLKCISVMEVQVQWRWGSGAMVSGSTMLKNLRCSGQYLILRNPGGLPKCQGDFWVMDDTELDPSAEIVGEWAGPKPMFFESKKWIRDCGCMGNTARLELEKQNKIAGGDGGVGMGRPVDFPINIVLSMPVILRGTSKHFAIDVLDLKISQAYRRWITEGLEIVGRSHAAHTRSDLAHYIPKTGEYRTQVSVRVSQDIADLITKCCVVEGVKVSPCVVALIGLGLSKEEERQERQDAEGKEGG